LRLAKILARAPAVEQASNNRLLLPDSMSTPTNRDCAAVVGTFNSVGAKVVAVLSDKVRTQRTLHSPNAAVAEVDANSSMPVILPFAEFIEPSTHNRRNRSMLRSCNRMGRHNCAHFFTPLTCGASRPLIATCAPEEVRQRGWA